MAYHRVPLILESIYPHLAHQGTFVSRKGHEYDTLRFDGAIIFSDNIFNGELMPAKAVYGTFEIGISSNSHFVIHRFFRPRGEHGPIINMDGSQETIVDKGQVYTIIKNDRTILIKNSYAPYNATYVLFKPQTPPT